MTTPDGISGGPVAAVEPASIYRELGVEPIINCGGVRSGFGGSNPMPAVVEAMERAAREFVVLDELAYAVGARLGELTGAEWGVVTSCSMAGMALATAACIAGHDPERMAELPFTTATAHKVAIPRQHRFAYDFVFRMVGATLVPFDTLDELDALLDGTVAMVCLLGRADASAALTNGDIIRTAKGRNVPVLVDAAAQVPTRPDRWIAMGADLVVYAGGKFVRGPQSSGFLIGSKRLCRMAWLNGPPHQAFGRGMKIGKEEIVGAYVALREFLTTRDANAEQAAMTRRLEAVAEAVKDLPGVTLTFIPTSPAWLPPRLRIAWEPAAFAVTADEVRLAMDRARPRIHIHDFWSTGTSIVIDPFNLRDSEAPVVGRAIAQYLLAHPGRARPSPADAGPVAGRWTACIEFLHGPEEHDLVLRQEQNGLSGFHETRRSRGVISGHIDGNEFTLLAKHPGEPAAIYYTFTGRLCEDGLQGDVALGAATREHFGAVFNSQFGTVKWTAVAADGEA